MRLCLLGLGVAQAAAWAAFGQTGPLDQGPIRPTVGLFDLASPLFTGIDGLMAPWLPAFGRLVVWGVVAAVVSMALYRLTSNQTRLAAIKAEMAALRAELAGFDGPFAEAWPLMRRNIALALRQLWVTFVPAVLASVPLIFLLVWLSNTFGARLPQAGDQIEVEAFAGEGRELPPLHWRGDGVRADGHAWSVPWPDDGTLALVESDGTVLLRLPTMMPVTIVHQRRWWNTLISNPGGYLPSGPVDAVGLDLPSQQFLAFGPDWLRGWMPLFFGVVIAVSLLLKLLWRLH